MHIKRIRVRNFRSIEALDLDLGATTVLIGANNAGKSAVLEALRIALTRRWGQRGTGFTEHDVFLPTPDADPRAQPPVSVEIEMQDQASAPWPDDLLQELSDVITTKADGRNLIVLRITCAWSASKEAFEPLWTFHNAAGEPLGGKAQRSINFSLFFDYLPLFWLDALRDIDDAFSPRSPLWGRLVKSVRIPTATESEVQEELDALDAKVLAADPKLAEIADTIGQATAIAIGDGPGGARLRMLPLNVLDMLMRAGVVMRHEDGRPWLPLDHHGQGLQSLSVLFLFQAGVTEQLTRAGLIGAEPVFAIEEPEAHLHPQASRTLWERVSRLPGQKLVTTHSPYFVQHVPLRDLRIMRLHNGRTQVSSMPAKLVSALPWNERVEKLAAYSGGRIVRDVDTACVAATSWLDPRLAEGLANCWKGDPDEARHRAGVATLRQSARSLVLASEEQELGFLGRRVRGEIFFARRWVLVEGVSEHLLLHAMGRALDYVLDAHGIAVIDFQNNGNASIYPSLATAFAISWRMLTDGDAESSKFRKQLTDRGFTDAELDLHLATLTPPHDLEDQLLADGHATLLREVLVARGDHSAATISAEELRRRLNNHKTEYMHGLAERVAGDAALARRMPKPFLDLFAWLQSSTP